MRGPERIQEVRLDRPLVGGDGIALRPDGSLVVMINPLASTATPAVAGLRSFNGWASARATAWHSLWDAAPTTAAVTPAGTYVLYGHLPELFGGTPTDGFTLRRLSN